MSLWTDARVKELMARVDALERTTRELLFSIQGDESCPVVDLDTLRTDYAAKFGKPPHHFMKAKSIMEALK